MFTEIQHSSRRHSELNEGSEDSPPTGEFCRRNSIALEKRKADFDLRIGGVSIGPGSIDEALYYQDCKFVQLIVMLDGWRQKAREQWQKCLSLFGDRIWDAIEPGDVTILMKKFASVFTVGPSSELPSDINNDTGNPGGEIERIEKLSNRSIGLFKFKNEGTHSFCTLSTARINNQTHILSIFRAKGVRSDSFIVDVQSTRELKSLAVSCDSVRVPTPRSRR